MRHFTRLLLPALILFLASGAAVYGQRTMGGPTGGGPTGGSPSGGNPAAGNTLGGGLPGSPGSTTTGRAGASSSSATLSQSNFLAGSYVNVYATGLYTDTTISSGGTSAGGTTTSSAGRTGNAAATTKTAASFFKTTTFGQPLYNISTTGANRPGTASIRGGANAAGGRGSATVTGSNDYGPVISGTRYPHVVATVKFPVSTKTSEQLTSELTNLINRSTSIKAKTSITFRVDDRIVTLTGTATDDDERRHIESLIQLQPGVRGVRNQLEVK